MMAPDKEEAPEAVEKIDAPTALVKAIAGVASPAELDVVSAAESGASIIARILTATTVEEVDAAAAPLEAENTRDLDGSVVAIRGVTFFPTAFEDRDPGSPLVYAVMDAANEEGEPVRLRTSSQTVMAQLAQYRRLGAFPIVRRITQNDRPTAAGFYPIRLEDPDAAAERAAAAKRAKR